MYYLGINQRGGGLSTGDESVGADGEPSSNVDYNDGYEPQARGSTDIIAQRA